MGEMRRAIAREEEDRRKQDRFASTLVIAAAIIAAARLAREDISRPSPRLTSVIAQRLHCGETAVHLHQCPANRIMTATTRPSTRCTTSYDALETSSPIERRHATSRSQCHH
jgi:hypothetical protein